ncbi:hypothetical protein F9278_32355 [Streptomyces phaeolivaceus]|uniref:Uncharacterized protein n=1 Tax=Streptomyces phaeolivaceus TaxID=2653200 RepID=A0A5P8KAD6_9ACTN|nr:DUF6177 family protein [Streptomyces phaeolivaceus]QFR00072.1 hypothetical protein F9278_32355 [Streptomyces phaeolivaceus]
MTKDVIALTPTMPDVRTVLAGLYAGGPGLGVKGSAEGAVMQLCAPGGRALVSVEVPVLIQVPGEVGRLLGCEVPDGPVWWTEARASTAVAEGERLAGSFAGRLAAVLGGVVWPPGAATTEVVPLTTDVSAVPVPDTAVPAVDVLTTSTAVVIQDRPVVSMTTWLSDALRAATAADRALQIVTPPTTRLTLATRTALRGLPNRWVVQHPDHGYYDGLSGAVLQWRNGTFGPVRDEDGTTLAARAFSDPDGSGERQLVVQLRLRHAPDERLVLGGALEAAWRRLTGEPPVGWSTAEPVNLPWNARQLTELARSRAPRPTWLVAVGHPDRPAIATVRVSRTPAGVEEDVTLTLGHGPEETPPLDAVEPLAAALAAGRGLTTMLVSLRAGRRDLTVPPHVAAPPVPVSLTVGAEAVREAGLANGRRPTDSGPGPALAPVGVPPVPYGPSSAPALHYPLGDGSDPGAWTRFQVLADRLRSVDVGGG